MIYHCQYHVQTVIIHPDKRQALNHNTTNHHQHSDGVNKSLEQFIRVIVLMRVTKSLFSLITPVNMWGTIPHPGNINSARSWKSSLERERRLVQSSQCSQCSVWILPIRLVTKDKTFFRRRNWFFTNFWQWINEASYPFWSRSSDPPPQPRVSDS